MRERIILAAAVTLMALAAIGTTVWRYERSTPEPEPAAAIALPVPPFPPRIASGDAYEHCLSILADDPEAGRAIADTWASTGGGDGAAHCQGLALIATGQPALGAERLEGLGKTSLAPDLAKATVLAQAAQARLMANQPARARDDVTLALALSPRKHRAADPTRRIGRRAVPVGRCGRRFDPSPDARSAPDGRAGDARRCPAPDRAAGQGHGRCRPGDRDGCR